MLPSIVSDAIATYQIDATAALGLVLSAGCVVYFAVQMMAIFRDFRGDVAAYGSGASGSDAGGSSSGGSAVPGFSYAEGASTAEYDRLADVWQGWTDQVESARAAGGVAPAASQSLALYDSLVERGMDAQDAIAAVEARNASVLASAIREETEYRERTGNSY